MVRIKLLAVLLVFIGALLSGCGKPDDASLATRSKAKVEDAAAALDAGKNQEALEQLKAARAIGGLGRGEVMFKAIRCQAVAYARLGEHDLAAQEVAALFEVAPSPAEALIVQSYCYEKQGQMSRAKAAYRRAKSFDKSIVRITD